MFRTLRGKLFASYALVIVLPIVLIGAFFFQRINLLMLRSAFDAERRSLMLLDERFRSSLDTYMEIADQIYLNERLARYFRAHYANAGGSAEGYYTLLQPLFSQYMAMHPEIRSITVYTNNPTMLVNGSELERPVPPEVEKSASGLIRWSAGENGDLVLTRRLNLHNVEIGVLRMAIREEFLLGLLGPRAGGDWHVATEGGTVVASTREDLWGGSLVADPLWAALPAFGRSVDAPARLDLPGSGRVTLLVMDIGPGERSSTGWRIVRTVSTSDVLGELRETLAVAGIICVVVLGLALLGASTTAGRLTRRFRVLAQSMGRVREGDFEARVEGGPDDEIGRLATHFNAMVERLGSLVGTVSRMEIQKRDTEIKRREAELYALQSQLNPHFLFNTLEAVISGIDEGRPGTSEVVLLLARCLRRNLHFTEDTIPLGEELTFVSEYLRICQFRMEGKLQWVIDVPAKHEGVGVPRFLLQPLVENAVLHGIGRRTGPGKIEISAGLQGSVVGATIRDDGVGMSPEVLASVRRTLVSPDAARAGEHIGLRNVAARLAYYFGARAVVDVESVEGRGTSVTLRFPAMERQGP